jgi:hypothetical protein
MSEESEELWYPAFNLAENPFRWQDRATERAYDTPFDLIPNEASELVIGLLKSKTSAIIVGDRGCGKSSALEIAAEKFGGIAAIGSHTLFDLVESLSFEVGRADMEELHRNIYKHRGLEVLGWIREFTVKIRDNVLIKTVCDFDQCPRKHRCDFNVEGMEGAHLIEKIALSFPHQGFCPFKRWLVAREYEFTLEEWARYFLFDAPDDITEVGPRYYRDFVRDLQFKAKGTVS